MKPYPIFSVAVDEHEDCDIGTGRPYNAHHAYVEIAGAAEVTRTVNEMTISLKISDHDTKVILLNFLLKLVNFIILDYSF